jgi:DNA-binding IscR family transcriptional regulator
LRQVVEYFEGPISVSDCIAGRTQCPFDTKCPVRCRWGKLQATIIHELEAIPFNELAQDALLEESAVSLPIFELG